MRVGALVDLGAGTTSTIEPSAPVTEAAQRVERPRCTALIVTENGHPVGIITRRDIIERVVCPRRSADDTAVSEVMTAAPLMVPAEMDVEEALALMIQHRVRHLPVTRGADDLAGMVVLADLVSWLFADREAKIGDLMFYITHG